MRCWILTAMIVVSLGPASGSNGSYQATNGNNRAETVAHTVVKFGAEYLVGKAIDRITGLDGKPDIDRIDARLQLFEEQLRIVDGNLANSIHNLRSELNERTSKEEISKVVDAALFDLKSKMESQLLDYESKINSQINATNSRLDANLQNANERIGQVNRQSDDLDRRLGNSERDFADLKRKMEDCFGYLPPIPPAPATFSDSRGFLHEPIVEPLIADYLRLAVKSESSRIKLSHLKQLHTANSRELQIAITQDRQIQAQGCDLHMRAKSNLAIKLLDRKELLQTYSKNHFKIQDIDRKLSSASWLVSSCKPISQEDGALRISVPSQLLSDRPGAILASFKLAGGDPAELSNIFKIKLQNDLKGGSRSATGFWERYRQIVDDQKLLESDLAVIPSLQNFSDKALAALDRAAGVAANIMLQETKNNRDLSKLGKLHPEIAYNRKTQEKLLADLKSVSSEIDEILSHGLQGYLRLLTSEQESANHMRAMYTKILLPLVDASESMNCSDWSSPTCQGDTWRRVYDKASRVTNVDTSSISKLVNHEARSMTISAIGNAVEVLVTSGCEVKVDGKSQEIIITALVKRENGKVERIETGKIREKLSKIQCVLLTKGGVGLCDDSNHLMLYGFDGVFKRMLNLPISPISVDSTADGSCLALLSKENTLTLFNPARNETQCCLYLEKPARAVTILEPNASSNRYIALSTTKSPSFEINDVKNLDFLIRANAKKD